MKFRITLIMLLASFILFTCQKPDNEEVVIEGPKKVSVVKVSEEKVSNKIKASGRLSSKEEMKLSFKTGGIIAKVLVKEGQKVKRGQALAFLQLDEINAQVQSAKLGEEKAGIDLENAKLALQLAERDYRNTKGLYEDSVATLEQLENVEVQLQNAKNQLSAAETGLSLSQQNQKVADFNLKYSKILAPSNGVILRKMAEPNEIVGPASPVFIFGSREKAFVIKINVTDKDIIHLNLGDEAKVNFDAYPNQVFKGMVKEIAGTANALTGTFEVEVEVESAQAKLLSGFIGTVEITTRNSADFIRLDAAALVSAEEKEGIVFIVKDQKVEKRKIHIHKLEGASLLIESGLVGNETVVIDGASYLEEGQAVLVN